MESHQSCGQSSKELELYSVTDTAACSWDETCTDQLSMDLRLVVDRYSRQMSHLSCM
jgi:hypothetical protein